MGVVSIALKTDLYVIRNVEAIMAFETRGEEDGGGGHARSEASGIAQAGGRLFRPERRST